MKRPKVPNRSQRSIEELVAASKHIDYELTMLNCTTSEMNMLASSVIRNASLANRKVVLNNALLESFALHARDLLSFLYAYNPEEDDIVAGDFVAEWEDKRPPKPDILKQAHQRFNKEMAHLTYKRLLVTEDTRNWEYDKIATELQSVMIVFVRSAPRDYLCTDLISHIGSL